MIKNLVVCILLFSTIVTNAQITSLDWVKKIGGSSSDFGRSIIIDKLGNTYTTGSFQGTVDFNPGSGTNNMSSFGSLDVFILKLDSLGNFVWAKQLGGSATEVSYSIALDASGNIYTTGYFQGTADFNPGSTTFNLTSSGSNDVFISKLDASGNFVWAKKFGSSSNEACNSIQVDILGNVYTTGTFRGTVDFNPGSGTFNLTSAGGDDIFILKLDASGNFRWAKKMGGAIDDDFGYSIALDILGNVYSTGNFEGTVDFNPGVDTFNLISKGNFDDIYISKLDSSGNFIWAKRFGGKQSDQCYSIALDISGNIYTTGYFNDTADFDPDSSTYNLIEVGGFDIFVSKLDSSGKFIWAKRLGGGAYERGFSIAVDHLKNVYTTGEFQGLVDFDPGPTSSYSIYAGTGYDIFISKLDSNGNFRWANRLGNTTYAEVSNSIAVDTLGNVYTTGFFLRTVDFDPGNGTFNLTSAGSDDIFIHKMGPCKNSASSITRSACKNFTSPSAKYVWTISGTYIDTIINNRGCDSVITVNLTIKNTSSNISVSSCKNYTSPSAKYVWTTTGTYKDTIPNTAGCDSVINITLTIQNTTSTISASSCKSYTSPSAKYTWTTSGTYKDTIPNIAGCDSIITINLKLNKNSSTIYPSECQSYISPSTKYTWSITGTYKDTIQNVAGCDSIITINLTIKNNSRTVSKNACDSYTSPSSKYIWYVSGTYKDTIQNIAGCDSFLTINLTIQTVNVSVTNSSPVLIANATNAVYKWVDCNNSYLPVSGALNKTFTANVNGSYAVIVTQNGCADTSICYSVTNVGVRKISEDNIYLKVYPNPTKSIFYLEINPILKDVTIIIRNMLGEEVEYIDSVSSNKLLFELNGSKGIYTIEVRTREGYSEHLKMLIE